MRYNPENLYSVKSHSFEAIPLPSFKEHRNKDYVYFGDNNLYPQKLVELFQGSAIHHTAIEAKSAAIKGEGFAVYGDTEINTNGETLNELFAKMALDYTLFGGFALNVVWARSGERIVEMYHLPFANVRSGKMNELDRVEEYFYSSDWTNTRKYTPAVYKSFNTGETSGDDASQIYYYYEYTPGSNTYPLPDYVGAVNDIELDARISRFHNANISQGLAPSLAINFRNGIPSPEERQTILRDIEDTFSGEMNAGRFFLLFSEAGKEAQIQPISASNDQYYITLEERITSRLLTAHRITSPLLLGIRDGGGLGSNKDELLVAWGHFYGTVIQPAQKKLVKELNWLTDKMGFGLTLEVKEAAIILDDTTIETDETTDIIE